MAQAAARRYEERYMSASTASSPRRRAREDVRVVPGKGVNPRAATLSPLAISMVKLFVVLLVAFAVLGAASITISNAAIVSLSNGNALQTKAAAAAETGKDLEIEHSILASPARIQKKAAALGMSAPSSVEHITVALPAREATYADGSLDIAGTISNIQTAALTAE